MGIRALTPFSPLDHHGMLSAVGRLLDQGRRSRSAGLHGRQDLRPVLPSTSYKDRALSRELILWESQSTTRASSETGLRYQQHAARGSSILLFARLRADERAFWYLGPAAYVRHDSECPMSIIWQLEHPLPGDLYASFAAAVA